MTADELVDSHALKNCALSSVRGEVLVVFVDLYAPVLRLLTPSQ